jgi:hypothetical protein
VFNESAGVGNDPLGPDPLRIVPLNTASEVPRGSYSVSGTVREDTLTRHRWTALSATEVPVTGGDTVVRLDARDAVPVDVTTPTPTEQRDRTVALRRHLPGVATFVEWQFVLGADATYEVYATPAAPARRGTVSFQDYWTLADRQVSLRVRGGMFLNPLYDTSTIGHVLQGNRTLPLVFAGDGSAEDVAAADVRGKLALVAVPDPGTVANPAAVTAQAARSAAGNAAAAGSAGVLTYVDVPGALPIAGLTTTPVPQFALSQAEGAKLRALGGQVAIDLAVRSPRFMYNLSYFDDNGIPADHVRPVDLSTLVPVDTAYHADRPEIGFAKQWTAYPPVPGSLAQRRTTWTGPARWTEYIGPADVRVPWQRRTTQSVPGSDLTMFAENVFRPGEPRRSEEHWFAAPLRNGALTLQPDHPFLVPATTGTGWVRQCAFCRGGTSQDRFVPALHWMDSNAGHFVTIWQNGQQYFTTTTTRLYRDGKEVPPDTSDPYRTFPVYNLSATTGKYRLTMVDAFPAAQRGGPSLALYRLAPKTETTWEFTSRRPTGTVPAGYGCAGRCAVQPLIQLDTQLGLGLDNTAPAGTFRFLLNAGHRPGDEGRSRPVPRDRHEPGERVRVAADPGLGHRGQLGRADHAPRLRDPVAHWGVGGPEEQFRSAHSGCHGRGLGVRVSDGVPNPLRHVPERWQPGPGASVQLAGAAGQQLEVEPVVVGVLGEDVAAVRRVEHVRRRGLRCERLAFQRGGRRRRERHAVHLGAARVEQRDAAVGRDVDRDDAGQGHRATGERLAGDRHEALLGRARAQREQRRAFGEEDGLQHGVVARVDLEVPAREVDLLGAARVGELDELVHHTSRASGLDLVDHHLALLLHGGVLGRLGVRGGEGGEAGTRGDREARQYSAHGEFLSLVWFDFPATGACRRPSSRLPADHHCAKAANHWPSTASYVHSGLFEQRAGRLVPDLTRVRDTATGDDLVVEVGHQLVAGT